ncbi:hypothetical protein SAMN04488120_102237 [Fontimonas thermophila]|uniref:Uncharacterized protein n=1 Tax=Fontimonas thermophila TaxID=1076937 RepID=A0A1I2HUU5_9GAMM|nr:hypothetical protein [Fontimonas thermophila]SFF33368.1 hypothetical protein SAMN04488120_102237 [Fontimonas thermophila]
MNRFASLRLYTLVMTATLVSPAMAVAGDGTTPSVVTGIGRIIAAQGNAALLQIRHELREELERTLRSWWSPQDVSAPSAQTSALETTAQDLDG